MKKVHIREIKTYNTDEIHSFFKHLFEVEKIVEKIRAKAGDDRRVLIKPNLLSALSPDKVVTTHPLIVETIVILLKENGFLPAIGDSPGGTVSLEAVWEKTGMKEVAEKHSVELLHPGSDGVSQEMSGEYKLYLDKKFLSYPVIINLAKYKTHSLTFFTGVMKNLFGLVPGMIKSDYHRYYPQPDKMAELLIALYDFVKGKVILNITDGIIGMEGEGPASGKPRNFGLVFASSSASALDYIAASMMGFKGMAIPMIRMGLEKDGIKPEEIEVSEKWQGFVFPNVDRGRGSAFSKYINKIPPSMQKLFFKLFDYYPDFNDSCRLCRLCEKGCPVAAITITKGGTKPVIDRNKCIKCMCCHEFCPYKAVYLKKTILARLILR